MDTNRPAPPCPECGGARFWYGNVEFWVGGGAHHSDDNLNAAVCGDCGYSSMYLQSMTRFRQHLAKMGLRPAEALADPPPTDTPPESHGTRGFFGKQPKPKKA